MLIRVPEYYEEFHCLAGKCPHTCCEKWEVTIDEKSACHYLTVPGPLGEKLRTALSRDDEGAFCFPLNGGRCPFLDGENLCEIHRQLGADATSVTCREHPRFIEDYGPFQEITLSASCPAANALLLGTEAPLTFSEQETTELGDRGDEWLTVLLPLRKQMMELLTDRTKPLKQRLRNFLEMAEAAQSWMDGDPMGELPEPLAPWQPETVQKKVEQAPGLFPQAFRFLGTLEILDPDWRRLLRQAETAAALPVSENSLERIAVYFAFRYLLKAVNDGDLRGRAGFCVFAVLVMERLAAVCGLPEALRRFSCEIEHSDENMAAVLEALQVDGPLAPARLFQQLSQ